jgi:hypothetical protein
MERFRQRCQNDHQARAGKCCVLIGRNLLLVPPLVESTLHAYSTQPAYTAKGLVEPAMVSLSALSAMPPSPGPKADEYQPAPQYSPSPGPFPDKNRPRTRSTTSPDPKKKQSPVSAVANESLMHSGRNFDALVGMNPVSKADFHWTLRGHQKYTQSYLDHAYDIVHNFSKCDIRVLHVIDPK